MLGHCFDPQAELHIDEQIRPHWSQAGTITFITFRTHDSIPREVLLRWERDKQQWLRIRGHAAAAHWSTIVPTLSVADQTDFNRTFDRCREQYLDTCQGRCVLMRPALAQIVANALQHFDGARYSLGDFIIMPNHVHLLAAFPGAAEMKAAIASCMRFSARLINQATGARGKFWQQEPFDHLVRSPEQYVYLRQYIADNPTKANLKSGEYLYRRCDR